MPKTFDAHASGVRAALDSVGMPTTSGRKLALAFRDTVRTLQERVAVGQAPKHDGVERSRVPWGSVARRSRSSPPRRGARGGSESSKCRRLAPVDAAPPAGGTAGRRHCRQAAVCQAAPNRPKAGSNSSGCVWAAGAVSGALCDRAAGWKCKAARPGGSPALRGRPRRPWRWHWRRRGLGAAAPDTHPVGGTLAVATAVEPGDVGGDGEGGGPDRNDSSAQMGRPRARPRRGQGYRALGNGAGHGGGEQAAGHAAGVIGGPAAGGRLDAERARAAGHSSARALGEGGGCGRWALRGGPPSLHFGVALSAFVVSAILLASRA